MTDKKEIVKILSEMADLMEFNGENRFKVNAFRNGANVLRKLDESIDALIKNNELKNVKGIGKGLQSVILEYTETGKVFDYEELKNDAPVGIKDLMKIRGLGAKKIRVLHDELGINSIGELEYACKENRLGLLKGFGEKTQEKILKEIKNVQVYSNFILLVHAEEIVDELKEIISEVDNVKYTSVSGEFRRSMEIISSVELVINLKDAKKLGNRLKKSYSQIIIEDDKIIINDFPVPVVLHLSKSEDEFFKKLFITTGSKEFLSKLKVNEKNLKGNNEEEIFKDLKSVIIIPEMREEEYFTLKKKFQKPTELSLSHFNGMLHFHTDFSDGRRTLEEMIDYAVEKDFQFAAVCDHSKAAFYANGLSEERVLIQKEEIKKLNSKKKIRILQGIECDILRDGDLDYNKDFLPEFDFIVASVHSRFNLDEDEMTKRILKAVENPNTDLLGHPSGRLLLSREPYKFKVKKIIDACAANDVAVEINANPRRLDLDWRYIFYAREKGCLFSVNPDAHSFTDVDYLKYGVGIARKGGLQPEEIINCYSFDEFKEFLSRKVKRNIQ